MPVDDNSNLVSLLQILWRGQEKIMADVAAPEEWDKGAGIKVADEF